MTCEKLIARLVAIADERPNAPIGHVVEHELPELRAQAELNQAQFLALENCRLLAARNRNEEWAQNILRFCDGAGVRAVTMRQVKAALAKGE